MKLLMPVVDRCVLEIDALGGQVACLQRDVHLVLVVVVRLAQVAFQMRLIVVLVQLVN